MSIYIYIYNSTAPARGVRHLARPEIQEVLIQIMALIIINIITLLIRILLIIIQLAITITRPGTAGV